MPTIDSPRNGQVLPSYHTHPSQRARISMIATPIGNLSDLSKRAIQVLIDVDEIWCEDTRHTQALLNALKIEGKRLRRVDQHCSEVEMRALLLEVEKFGQWIGVVSDAGTPGLSDPGAQLARLLAYFPNIKIEPIPGPSALTAFVSIAALPGNSFVFHGFFPRNEGDAIKLLKSLNESPNLNHIFFESPNRIQDTLKVLLESSQLPDEAQFTFAKELSKVFETVYRGQGLRFLQWLQGQNFDTRGEWVFSLSLPKNCVKTEKQESNWELSLQCLMDAEISAKTASQIIVDRFGIAKNLAYKKALELKK